MKCINGMYNDCIENEIFPDNLELVDVSPIFKKEDNFEKENY